MEKSFAILLFERCFKKDENRFELITDFLDEMNNLHLEGDFSIIQKENGRDGAGDVILLKIAEDDTKVTDLYYHKASFAANMSYSFSRKVELHVFVESEIIRLQGAKNGDDFLKIKKEIISPKHHLLFDKGELIFFGEIYDILDYL